MNDLSKEEILKNLKPVNGFLKKVDISKAMDIWADQQAKKEAIEFAEWIDKSSFSAMDIDDDKIVWYSKNESQKTTEQLYELFKQK